MMEMLEAVIFRDPPAKFLHQQWRLLRHHRNSEKAKFQFNYTLLHSLILNDVFAHNLCAKERS